MYYEKENNFLKRAVKVSLIETKSILFSGRWIAVTILSFVLLLHYLRGAVEFANAVDLYINPVVFPFLFSDYLYANMAMMIVIFLVSAFPLSDDAQMHIRMKCGNGSYVLAQLMSVFYIVVCWIIQMQLLSFLVIGDRCLFGGWGKVWGAIASGKAWEAGYNFDTVISVNIILHASPLETWIVSTIVILFTAIVFAEIIYLIDCISGKNFGEIILMGWSFVCILLARFDVDIINRIMMTANPASWLNINDYMKRNGQFGSVVLKMSISVVFFAFLIVLAERRKKEYD